MGMMEQNTITIYQTATKGYHKLDTSYD